MCLGASNATDTIIKMRTAQTTLRVKGALETMTSHSVDPKEKYV